MTDGWSYHSKLLLERKKIQLTTKRTAVSFNCVHCPAIIAGLVEMNSLVGKSDRAEIRTKLRIESKAGKVFESLQLDLGYPHAPPQLNQQGSSPAPKVSAAQVHCL